MGGSIRRGVTRGEREKACQEGCGAYRRNVRRLVPRMSSWLIAVVAGRLQIVVELADLWAIRRSSLTNRRGIEII